jgi:hypothetical protein
VEITLDVGSEIASLLQKLADQIGVTVAQIFPWYVQQAHTEGIIELIGIFVIAILAFTSLTVGAIGTAEHGIDSGPYRYIFLVFGGGFLLFVFILIAMHPGGGLSGAITKITNPNYHAMQMLTRDIGKLRGR